MEEVALNIAQKINTLHEGIMSLLHQGVEKAVEIGELLTTKKAELKYGEFGTWIKDNLVFTDRTARRYMLLFDNKDKILQVGNISEAYKMLEAPKTDTVSDFNYVEQLLSRKTNIVTMFTGNNEWYTPDEYIELARKTMGIIDLDPASSDVAQKTIKAKKYFTIEDNGLDQEWKGNIWLNPPYSGKEIVLFIDKIINEYQIGNIKQAIVLTNDNTDTSWFHKLAKISSVICFLRGRIKFYNADEKSAPTNGQVFFYIGNNPTKFKEYFSEVGLIMQKA